MIFLLLFFLHPVLMFGFLFPVRIQCNFFFFFFFHSDFSLYCCHWVLTQTIFFFSLLHHKVNSIVVCVCVLIFFYKLIFPFLDPFIIIVSLLQNIFENWYLNRSASRHTIGSDVLQKLVDFVDFFFLIYDKEKEMNKKRIYYGCRMLALVNRSPLHYSIEIQSFVFNIYFMTISLSQNKKKIFFIFVRLLLSPE